MQHDWPTEEQDMYIASVIVEKHMDYNDGEPLGLIEVLMDRKEKKPVSIKISHWVAEILVHFRDQYGRDQGPVIAGKVITRLLLKDETIH